MTSAHGHSNFIRMFRRLLPILSALALLSGCAHSSRQRYAYTYVPGRTATLHGMHAVAPASAPSAVKAAITAGNRIAGLPYVRGRGHTRALDSAYDCSGSASWVLCQAGLLDEPTTSSAFRSYGERGEGRWISVYARDGHVFMSVAGLRFDTGWGNSSSGPRWTTRGRPLNGAIVRHPAGL